MSAARERKEVRMKNAQDLAEQTREFEPTAVRLPEGVEWFSLKALEAGERGKSIDVDFMPYIVGVGNPDADEGYGYYRRRYWVHRIPTPKAPKGVPFCCEATFGRKNCRICRWLLKVANEEMSKSCKAKGRYLWLVNSKPGTPPGEKDNPWKVYETTDWLKGQFPGILQDAINVSEGGMDFCDLKKGLTARMLVKKQEANEAISNAYNGVTRIDLIPRKHTYSSSLIQKAPCLDSMLIDTPGEELDEILGGDEQPATRSSRAAAKEPDSAVEPSTPEPSEPEGSSVEEPSDASASAPEGSSVEEPSTPEPAPRASKNGKEFRTFWKVGQFVNWKKKEWEIKKVSSDGTSLTIEDEDGHMKHASPSECKLVPVADAKDSDVEDSDVEPSDVEPKKSSRK